jgi:hypothetical protein
MLLGLGRMRAIPLIILMLAGCGDDTSVATSTCQRNHTCCCGSPTLPSPCIQATEGQQCLAGQACSVDSEQGGSCTCATNIWTCTHPYADMTVRMDMTMLLDMTDRD